LPIAMAVAYFSVFSHDKPPFIFSY
jgi:hypothetical protein